MLSEAQLEFLETAKDTRDRYAYTDNQRPVIDELCADGVLEPANGEMKMLEAARNEQIRIANKDIPIIGELVSLYMLTPEGRAALQEAEDD